MTKEEALFEIWVWRRNNTGSFCSLLLDLMGKADRGNFLKLFMAFPELGQAYKDWYDAPSEDEFLNRIKKP